MLDSVFSTEPLACLNYFQPDDYDILRSKVYPHIHMADEFMSNITNENVGLVMDNLRQQPEALFNVYIEII